MILVAYRHGFRASEWVDLRWDQIDVEQATLAVRRVKNGSTATQPIRGDELRAQRKLAREQDPKSPLVFMSQRGSPFTRAGFARMVERAGMPLISGLRRIRTCCAIMRLCPGQSTLRGVVFTI